MKRMTVTAIALALGISLPAPAGAESLREALATAYTSNPDLLAARARQRQVDEAVSQAVSQWRPTVTGQVQFTHSDISSETTRSTDQTVVNDNQFNGLNESFTARIDQPVFRGLQNFNQYEGAKAEVKAGRFNLLDTEQQVLLQAVTSYMDVLRDEAVVRLNNNNIRVLQRQLEATQDRFQVGEVTRTDVAQSEAALAGAKAQLARAEATLEQSRSTYRQVIGNFPGTLEDTPSLPPLPGNEEEAVAIALEENPIVMAARFNEKAADYDIREAKGAILPTISAFADYSRRESPLLTFDPVPNAFVDGRNLNNTARIGVTIDVPLYQSGAEYSNIRRAKQVRSERIMQIRSAERQVMRDVRVAWENYRASQSTIESTRSQTRANEIALEGVRQEAQVGARTTLDVLEAEQTLLNSRVDLVTANRDSYVAGFGVLQSVGRLNAKSLDLPVDLYDATRYYEHVKWKFIGWGDDGIGEDAG